MQKNRLFSLLTSASAMALVRISPTLAADTYVLPHGAGTKTGASWADARDASKGGLQQGWDATGPGETCFVGGGTYEKITLTIGEQSGGNAGKFKKLVGVAHGNDARPVFVGAWTKDTPAKGADGITLKPGASFWAIENIEVRHYRNAVISSGGRHVGVRITNLDATEIRAGMELAGGGLAAQPEIGTHDVLIKDCDFTHFTKRGIRFQGGNYNVRVENCVADAGGKDWATEPFHMGFQIQGAPTSDKKATEASADHDITFAGCVAKNSYNDAGKGYWNADGFCAESTPYNLRYENCTALNNTDGGWDDKSRNPVLLDCVALRNKRNYRFWTHEGQAQMTNCLAALAALAVMPGGSGGATGLWTKGGVRAENCTFYDNPINLDLSENTAQVELVRCIVSESRAKNGVNSHVDAGSKLTLTDTVSWQEGKTRDEGDADPRFPNVPADWNGIGPLLNSGRYGKTRGYFWEKAPLPPIMGGSE